MGEGESANGATNAMWASDAVCLRVCSPDSSSSHFEFVGETPLSAFQRPSTPVTRVSHLEQVISHRADERQYSKTDSVPVCFCNKRGLNGFDGSTYPHFCGGVKGCCQLHFL